MIGRLRGVVVAKELGNIMLDVQGVGYTVLAPSRVIEASLLESEVTIHTYLQVREDALTLYGFHTLEEKRLFELLVSISGIGPKLGLAILSTYTPHQVQQAISAANASFFSAVSGIGKKNAERIILELKNKVWSSATFDSPVSGGNDLVNALLSLGYSPIEVATVTQSIDATLAIDDQIKQGLAKLARGT